MVKFSSQLYSVLFFVAISLLTIIIVQTFYSFLKSAIEFQLFLVSIIIELIFVFVIIKVYDELGCKWENVQTIPLLTKKKAYSTTVQHNYYYNNNNNNNESKTIFCSNCGIPLSYSSINLNQESIPKFCRNCGVFLTNSIPGGFQQKE
jgi:ribosomal protein S27AE